MASPARAATLVYVGNAESNEIHVLQLDRQSGDLAVIEKVAIPINQAGHLDPDGGESDRRFLYVGTRGEPKLAVGVRHRPRQRPASSTWPAPARRQHGVHRHRSAPANSCSALRIPGHKLTVNPIGSPAPCCRLTKVLTVKTRMAHSILPDASNGTSSR